MLGVVPSLVEAWQNTDAARGLDWSSLRLFSSTGECSNSDDYLYLMSSRDTAAPLSNTVVGTRSAAVTYRATIVQPCSPAAFTTPSFGLDFYVLDELGRPARSGELFIVPPSIGLSNNLLNKDHHEVLRVSPLSRQRRRDGGFSHAREGEATRVVANLIAGGFEGEIVLVNPSGGELMGLKIYTSLEEYGKPIDMSVIVVPTAVVKEAVVHSLKARREVHRDHHLRLQRGGRSWGSARNRDRRPLP